MIFTGERENIPLDNFDYCDSGGGRKDFTSHTPQDVFDAVNSGRNVYFERFGSLITLGKVGETECEFGLVYLQADSADTPLYQLVCGGIQ